MKSVFRKILSGVVSASIIFSAFSATMLTSSAAAQNITTNGAIEGYSVYAEIPDGATPYSEITHSSYHSDGFVVWLGGGKGTLGNGAIVDGKVSQVNLYNELKDSSGNLIGSYNITSAKDVGWAVGETASIVKASDGTVSSHGMTMVSGKPATKNDNFSVSKGKVTAGSKEGTGYVYAYTSKKVGTTTTYTPVAVFKVTTKAAAGTIEAQKKLSNGTIATVTSSGTVWYAPGAEKSAKMSTLDVSVNEVQHVFFASVNKKDVAASSANEFTISVAADKKTGDTFVEVSNDGTTGWGDSISFTGKNGWFFVRGKALTPGTSTTPDKASKAVITIQNNQSGKSTKITANVTNGVSDARNIQPGSAAATSDGTANGGIHVIRELTNTTNATTAVNQDIELLTWSDGTTAIWDYVDSSGATDDVTVKPTLGVFTAAYAETNFWNTDGTLKLDKLTETKNNVTKVKFAGLGKDDVKATGFGVSFKSQDKTNTKITLKTPKTAYAVVYVVAAYGPTANQIAITKVTIGTPPAKITAKVITGKDTNTVAADVVLASSGTATATFSSGVTTTTTKGKLSFVDDNGVDLIKPKSPWDAKVTGVKVGTADYVASTNIDLSGEANTVVTFTYKGTTYTWTITAKPATPVTTLTLEGITAPAKDGTPASAAKVATADAAKYTAGTLTWHNSDGTAAAPLTSNKFNASTVYSAKVKLTAKTGYDFNGLTSVTVSGATVTLTIAQDKKSVDLLIKFSATSA